MIRLIRIEVRRALLRQSFRLFVTVVLLGLTIGATVTFFRSHGLFHLTGIRNAIDGFSGVMIIAGLMIGASSVGAEWNHRTMTTSLTWEPRRGRILVAKVAGIALAVFVGVAAILVFFGLILTPSALFRGTTAGADAAWYRGIAGMVLRASSVAAVTASIGASLGMLVRNTAGALGAGVVYLAVLERALGGLVPGWRPWLLGENIAVFLTGEQNLFVPGRTTLTALAIVLSYVAAFLGASAYVFRRVDVA